MGFESGSDISSDERLSKTVQDYLPNIKREKEHKCEFSGCNKVFSRPSKLRRHMCIHSQEKQFACKYANCNKKYGYLWHLKRHINSVHEKPLYREIFKCPQEGCTSEFTREFSLRRHVKASHEEPSPDVLKYACKQCPEKFRKKCQLAAHVFTHTHNLESISQEIKCDKCSLVFMHLSDFKKHIAYHKTYTCHCGETFTRWSVFLCHQRTQHTTSYPCTTCSKIFKTKGHLKTHEKIHSDVRKVFECEYKDCPRYYLFSKNLKHHVKVFHLAEKFVCTFDGCDRSFVKNVNLKEHLKTHDPNWVRRQTVQKKTKRNIRKDAGKPKKEMALHLAGMIHGADINLLKDVENNNVDNDEVNIDNSLKTPNSVSGVLNIVDKSKLF